MGVSTQVDTTDGEEEAWLILRGCNKLHRCGAKRASTPHYRDRLPYMLPAIGLDEQLVNGSECHTSLILFIEKLVAREVYMACPRVPVYDVFSSCKGVISY